VLRCICRLHGRHVTFQLVVALVFSRLDQAYCDASLPAIDLAPLHRVLHIAALVNGLRPHGHVTPAVKELHVLPISQQIQSKLCVLVYMILIGYVCLSTLLFQPASQLSAVADVPFRSALRDSTKGNFVVWLARRVGIFCFCSSSRESASHGTKHFTFNSIVQT